MIELFSGKATIAAAFRRAGWSCLTVDQFCDADIKMDVREFKPGRADFVWSSFPCVEFSASSMPWHPRFNVAPSLDLFHESLRVVRESGAEFWAFENVRGAERWINPDLGDPMRFGPVRVWSNLPVEIVAKVNPWKQRLSSARRAERAALPRHLAAAVVEAVESSFNTLFTEGRQG
jgi:site-specific DNA-cytosine methylase